MIPLVDLKKQFESIEKEVFPEIKKVIKSFRYIQGQRVEEFEKKFSKKQNLKYVVGCANGTTALSLILKSLGLGEYDEIITTPNTFIATAESICHVGAKPVFVDVDQFTYNLDPDKIEAAITKKTKAIIPVHIYGNPADMDKILKIAKKYRLAVIEDCAQAHLAKYKNKYVGNFGEASGFSFYPGKNLGAYGDAGAIGTNSSLLANKCRSLLNHGRTNKYLHHLIGYNYRMDEIQAAILTIKLKYLKKWTKKRQRNANFYNHFLSPQVTTPTVTKNASHVYHLYVIRVKNRDEVVGHLKTKGIQTLVHYPIPLHLQPALKYLGYKKGRLPNVESVVKEIISLPMYPELTKNQIEFISKEVNKVAK